VKEQRNHMQKKDSSIQDGPHLVRRKDPAKTRMDILEVATKEFAHNGLSGARINEIAERTETSKRMLYYYFGDKEGLYLAVLEAAYQRIRSIEATLELDNLPVIEALRSLVNFTFDFAAGNEDFIRLVMIENIHNGEYLAKSKVIRDLNVAAIEKVRKLCDRGQAEGVFRDDIDPVGLHWQISALCFFNVSNRATFEEIFRSTSASHAVQAQRREQVADMVVRYVVRSTQLLQSTGNLAKLTE
jgi:AcrR family transcriptional regulator